MTDTVMAPAARPSPLRHPILAWRAYQVALAERADAEARAAGLTVEDVGHGVRRYREPRLDEALAAYRARHGAPDHAAVDDVETSAWSPTRHVTTTAIGGWER